MEFVNQNEKEFMHWIWRKSFKTVFLTNQPLPKLKSDLPNKEFYAFFYYN